MSTKNIALKVPSDFDLPFYLSNTDPKQLALVLELADVLLESANTYNNDAQVKTLQDKYDTIIKNLQEKLNQKELIMENQREEAVRIAKAELKGEVNGKDIVIQELRKQIDDHKCQIQKLDEKLRDTEQKKEEYLEKLQDKKLTLANPQKKGFLGELVFKDLAMKVMGWDLEPTGNASKHHQTDWKYRYNDINVYFEIKKYEDKNKKEKAVPHEQYEKFVNDMNRNLEIDIGFYISLDIPIAYTNDMKIEYTPSNQMLVIVPKFLESEDQIPLLFHQFALLMMVAKRNRKLLETNDVDEKNNAKLQRLSTYLINMMKRIKNGKKDYDTQKEQLQQVVDNIRQNQDAFYASLIQDAASTLAILCDDEKYVEPVEETEQPLNLPNLAKEKKKRTTKAKVNES